MDTLNIILITAVAGFISKIIFDWLKSRKSNNGNSERRKSMEKLTQIAQHSDDLAVKNNELLVKISDVMIKNTTIQENLLDEARRQTGILINIRTNGNSK